MKRAVNGGTSGITWVLAALGVVALGLLGWRELRHREAESQWLEAQAALQLRLEDQEAANREQSARADQAAASLAEASLSLQGMSDRVTNLEAQRDHLRAEVDRQVERTRQAEASAELLQASLESSREALLQAEALPDSLSGELARERERIAYLESKLDHKAAGNAGIPPLLEVAGTSQDGTVFALSGPLPAQDSLPVKVYVCRSDRILLQGWINRIEDEAIIAHVLRWESPASALVKGEKVFILPGNSHEAD
ncbi:MAG TPA: hypothetical protein VK995_04650 [Oceanipulchritudo sp.]|nr:hypothetical protein [Oceanipulchritudo sp.]